MIPALSDGSALVTGILLCLCLPAFVPWWLPVFGVAFAILVSKHLYGGLGNNVFNPAMAGYAVLLISFPRELSLWPADPDVFRTSLADTLAIITQGGLASTSQWDAITGATVLDHARTLRITSGGDPAIYSRLIQDQSMLLNVAFLAGGIWLWAKHVIGWHIPVALLTCLLVLSTFHSTVTEHGLSPLIHLFSGATMLTAFFIATDPVSAATGVYGKLIYAAGIAVIAWTIRSFGGYPDGFAFAVLLMNCTVPLLDQVEPHWSRQTRRDESE